MILDKLASAIKNDIISGLGGMHSASSISLELLKDDIIDTRLLIIKEYQLKGITIKDLLITINCLDVDCKNLDRCGCLDIPTAHFEIPLLILDFGNGGIEYIGTTDGLTPFTFYTLKNWNIYNKYRKRGKNKPYIYIDITPNENGMYDGYIFNAPMIKHILVTAMFKDPRQLEFCKNELQEDNFSFINADIKNRVTELKIKYYRLLQAPLKPNNQIYKA